MSLCVEKVLKVVILVAIFSLPFFYCFGQETYVDNRDKNTYRVVTIGKQVWMAENLRYLPQVNSPSSIDDDDYYNSKYFVYGYDGTDVSEAKKTQEYNTYGVLYNMVAAKTACPSGWHLPKDSEWKKLEKTLGVPGKTINEIGYRGKKEGTLLAGDTALWKSGGKVNFKDHISGTSGFKALPAGHVSIDRKFHDLGEKTNFWTATDYCEGYSYFRSIGINNFAIYRNNSDYRSAMSVRCIKN